MCAPDAAIICSHAKRAIGWDQPIFVVSSIAPLRMFTAAWASVIFDRPTASHTNHFGFSIGSYPTGLLRLLTVVGTTSGREAGGGAISFLLCSMCNGPVTTCLRLACALRYFAGASPIDIMAKYGICEKSVSESVWAVVEAVNTLMSS